MEDQMAIIEWAHICENAILDQEGKISLIAIFGKIYGVAFPAVHPKLYVAFVIKNDGTAKIGKVKTEIISPENEMVTFIESDIEVLSPYHSVFHEFRNVLFKTQGIYQIKIFINGTDVTPYALELNLLNLTDRNQK